MWGAPGPPMPFKRTGTAAAKKLFLASNKHQVVKTVDNSSSLLVSTSFPNPSMITPQHLIIKKTLLKSTQKHQSRVWETLIQCLAEGCSKGKSLSCRNSLMRLTKSSGVWQAWPRFERKRASLPNTWSTSSCECPLRRLLIVASRKVPEAKAERTSKKHANQGQH